MLSRYIYLFLFLSFVNCFALEKSFSKTITGSNLNRTKIKAVRIVENKVTASLLNEINLFLSDYLTDVNKINEFHPDVYKMINKSIITQCSVNENGNYRATATFSDEKFQFFLNQYITNNKAISLFSTYSPLKPSFNNLQKLSVLSDNIFPVNFSTTYDSFLISYFKNLKFEASRVSIFYNSRYISYDNSNLINIKFLYLDTPINNISFSIGENLLFTDNNGEINHKIDSNEQTNTLSCKLITTNLKSSLYFPNKFIANYIRSVIAETEKMLKLTTNERAYIYVNTNQFSEMIRQTLLEIGFIISDKNRQNNYVFNVNYDIISSEKSEITGYYCKSLTTVEIVDNNSNKLYYRNVMENEKFSNKSLEDAIFKTKYDSLMQLLDNLRIKKGSF